MGIDYRPIVGVGKYFEDEAEAGAWYLQKYSLDEIQAEELEKHGLTDYLYDEDGSLEGTYQNGYTADGYYLYIPIESGSVSAAITGLQVAAKIWYEKFGEEPEFITDICVARYSSVLLFVPFPPPFLSGPGYI